MTAAVTPIAVNAASRSPGAIILRKLFRRRLVLVGAVILGIVAALAIFAPWITPYDPMALKILDRLQSPRTAHWFGTDELGRDVFSRVIFGARYSLMIGAMVVLISMTGGVLLGLTAGFFRRLDGPIMRAGRRDDVVPGYPAGDRARRGAGRVDDQRDPRARHRLHAARRPGRAGVDAGCPRACCSSRPRARSASRRGASCSSIS